MINSSFLLNRYVEEEWKDIKMYPLLNNTKWREILTVLAENEVGFVVKLIDQPIEKCLEYIDCFEIEENRLADGAIGVPTEYSKIQLIQIPKNPKSSHIEYIQGRSTPDISSVINRIVQLGKIPLEEYDTYYEIQGYTT